MKEIDFTRDIKDELAKIKITSKSQKIAELAGFIRINSKILLSQGEKILQIYTENASVARRILTFLKEYTDSIDSSIVERDRKSSYQFNITDEDKIDQIFKDIEFIGDNIFVKNYNVSNNILRDSDHSKAYLRGAFLAGGVITDPKRAYHLEIQTGSEEMARSLTRCTDDLGIPSKISNRRDSYFIYVKDSDLLGDLIFNLGTTSGYLKLQDIKVFKDMRNNINRLVNSETANINKTVKAAMKQIDDIKFLIEMKVFDNLPEDIQNVAMLRMEHPEASLSDISRLSGGMSRSAINYRLQKIATTANKLRGAE